MSFEIQNLVTETVRSFSGMKSALPHGILQPGDSEDCRNFVTRRGRLRKIWGSAQYYNSGLGAGEIGWLEYFRDKWIAQHGNTIIREQTEAAADFIALGSIILGATNRVRSEKWENRIYLTNGVENRYLEDVGNVNYVPGGTFLDLGLIPPGNGARNWDGSGAFQPELTFTEVKSVGTPQIPFAPVAWGILVVLPACTRTAGTTGSGVGDILTANANGFLILDSNLPSIGDRVAVGGQADQTDNGIYTVNTVGDAVTAWVLVRATDFDNADLIKNGATFLVNGGLLNAGSTFQCTFAGGFVHGATNLAFVSIIANPSPLGIGLTFGYVLTWWDANRRIESLPWGAQVDESGLWRSFALAFASGNAFSMSDNGFSNLLDITALKAAGYDASRVTHFIPYRWTQADNATFKRIADPDAEDQEPLLRIANNTFNDTTKETDLGVVLDESLSPPPSGLYYGGKGNKDTDQAPIGPRFVKFFRDQLWLFGARYPGTANAGKLQPDGVSSVQTNFVRQDGIAYASQVDNHEYWQFDYAIGRASGQKDTGMGQSNATLMFFKERSTYYLTGSNPSNYEIRTLDENRGFTVPGSIKDTTKGVIGLGIDGFALFDGVSQGRLISEEISDFVARINLDFSDKIYATFDPHEEKYECHVPLDKAAWNTHVFSYDCKLQCWQITQRVGASAAYGISSKKKIVGMIGDSRNGRLYDVSDYSLVTLNGQTILGVWRSRAFDFGAAGRTKTVRVVEITARAVMDFQISVDLIADFGESDTASVSDISPDTRGDVYAKDQADEIGMKWNSGQWSKGVTKKKFTILIENTGKNFNLVVRNSDNDANRASFEIEEILVHASMLEGEDEK